MGPQPEQCTAATSMELTGIKSNQSCSGRQASGRTDAVATSFSGIRVPTNTANNCCVMQQTEWNVAQLDRLPSAGDCRIQSDRICRPAPVAGQPAIIFGERDDAPRRGLFTNINKNNNNYNYSNCSGEQLSQRICNGK